MRLVLLLLCALSLVSSAQAQQSNQLRTFQALRSQVTQVSEMRGVIEVRLRWVATPPQQSAPGGPLTALSLVRQTAQRGSLGRERRPELSIQHLVIVSTDRDGREIDWRLAPNPRTIRAEFPGPDGVLTGRTFESASVVFDVHVPDLPATDRVQVYQPSWSGTEYALRLLGSVDVRAR